MRQRIKLHGHRGARGLFPENTMVGFAGALRIGVDALELDVGVTADDVVVVTHDPRLNTDITRDGRTGAWLSGVTPAIRSLRAAELGAYDVGRIRPGSTYATEYPDQDPKDGASIPRLAEVLEIDPVVCFTVELKSLPLHSGLTMAGAEMAEAAIGVADACGVVDRIVLQSFDWRGPRHLRRTRPEVPVSWLTSAATLMAARTWWDGPDPSDFGGSVPRAIAAEGGPIWGPDFRDLTEAMLAEAHDLGLKVVPWTVNRPQDMRRLMRWGVDGLITDRPDLARCTLAELEAT
jgi:glycerophosphoryl diester phosphodiesterase